MRYFPSSTSGMRETIPMDPYHYVRLADLALLYGNRDQAEALVTMAYLAFDLMLAGSDEVTSWGRMWPGRNS